MEPGMSEGRRTRTRRLYLIAATLNKTRLPVRVGRTNMHEGSDGRRKRRGRKKLRVLTPPICRATVGFPAGRPLIHNTISYERRLSSPFS